LIKLISWVGYRTRTLGAAWHRLQAHALEWVSNGPTRPVAGIEALYRKRMARKRQKKTSGIGLASAGPCLATTYNRRIGEVMM
jgi:hypothetical protein